MNILKGQAIILSFLLISACHYGPQTGSMMELRRPQGASVTLERLVDGKRQRDETIGELIEVREAGVLMVVGRSGGARLVFVPWTEVYRLQVRELDERQLSGGSSRNRRDRDVEKIRVVSRYPQGLSDELLQGLLAGYKQQTLESIAD